MFEHICFLQSAYEKEKEEVMHLQECNIKNLE